MLYHKPTGRIIIFPIDYERRFVIKLLKDCDKPQAKLNMEKIINYIKNKEGCDNFYGYDSYIFIGVKPSEFQVI